MVGGDILWEMMVGCLEDGPKWCSILVSTTEVRTTLLFYIYGSWVKVRELLFFLSFCTFVKLTKALQEEEETRGQVIAAQDPFF